MTDWTLARPGPASTVLALVALLAAWSPSAGGNADSALDTRVRAFLDSRSGQWHDMNVPEVDGRTLHDLIVSHRYTRALEIGTSTGHSGVWIAWALSKTGGRLITIDIDERRHEQALANFETAGVTPFIDARLADAHVLVPALPGPFDFVFSDADKDWNVKYLEAVLPKLAPGGCYTTHNIRPAGGFGGQGGDYLRFAERQPSLETTVDTRGAGLAISFKKKG
jgi:predicted O-methyltransferase YrrM